MNLHEEVARVAYGLYEKSGHIRGQDIQNWLEAEKSVLARVDGKGIEEPGAKGEATRKKAGKRQKKSL